MFEKLHLCVDQRNAGGGLRGLPLPLPAHVPVFYYGVGVETLDVFYNESILTACKYF